MDSPSVVIAVATHKAYQMPGDPVYLPVQVGASLHPDIDLGYQKDNDGDNISQKNDYYSELTALWWVWKNTNADYKGLVHYRRHFASPDPAKRRSKDRFERIATGEEILNAIKGVDVLLPSKRRYYIESVYSHYDHTFDGAQLDCCREVLAELDPEYVPAWDKLMASTSAYICNMFVMSSDLLDAYCSWLFPLLEVIETRLDTKDMDDFQRRWPGRVAERMFNAWIIKNEIKYAELPMLSTEPVDWPKKAGGFLAAKFFGKKYEKSF